MQMKLKNLRINLYSGRLIIIIIIIMQQLQEEINLFSTKQGLVNEWESFQKMN